MLTSVSVYTAPSAAKQGETRFYSIPGPDGIPIIIERPLPATRSSATIDAQTEGNLPKQAEPIRPIRTQNSNTVSPSVTAPSLPLVAAPASMGGQENNQPKVKLDSTLPSSAPKQSDSRPVPSLRKSQREMPPTNRLDGQDYIESEYLEQRQFNLTDRKRFYSVPDGTGQQLTFERDNSQLVRNMQPPVVNVAPMTLSERYRIISASEVGRLLGQACIDPKMLRRARTFQADEISLWPQPALSQQQIAFDIARLPSQLSGLRFLSFASRERNPTYYWPLAAFLNERGCVIEGASQFYQDNLPATSLQHAGLRGTLRVPAGSRFLLITPLAESPDLTQVRLTNRGALRLVALP